MSDATLTTKLIARTLFRVTSKTSLQPHCFRMLLRRHDCLLLLSGRSAPFPILLSMFFELTLEVAAPAFGQRFVLHGAPQCFQIVPLKGKQPNNVFNSEAIAVPTDQFDLVSGLHLTLSCDRKIEPTPAAGEKPLENVCPSEFNRQLVARYALPRNHEFRSADARAVANIDFVL